MLRNVYERFNREYFCAEKYKNILEKIFMQAGETCLRMCETPVFISRDFADKIVQGAIEIIRQSMALAENGQLENAVPPAFRMAKLPEKPSFFIVDFAVTRDTAGQVVPRLIELQAFASNLVFIPAVAKIYKEIYELDDNYSYLLSDAANHSVAKAILEEYPPENVVLMEIDPWRQQSRRDFVVTQKWLGIPVVDIRDIIKEDNKLFYRSENGSLVQIRRIYNRVVPAEFKSLNLAEKIAFSFNDRLDVEWVNDPEWFLKISKYAMPYLDHEMVPASVFLNQLTSYPSNLENYVLKPAFANAGIGVKMNITKEDLDAVPLSERHRYILMRKVDFFPFIPDLKGHMLNAELRVMFVWHDELKPIAMSARVMRGNDVNGNLWGNDAWCGLAPVLIVEDEKNAVDQAI